MECRIAGGGYADLARRFSARKGEANPNFKHGERMGAKSFTLPSKGEAFCRICPAVAVHAHHAVPRSIGTRESYGDLRNCLPLCGSCHRRWHLGTLTIMRDVFTEDEWGYISTLELTGREITAWLDKHYPRRSAEDVGTVA